MDYLVVPSVWYETYSLVAQEALGAGVPVVASHLGALTERVREGETGRLFEPGDSADLARVLAHLIQHPELRDLYRSHIRPGSTIEEHAGQILALYSQVQHEAVTH
jgi:glycosyltransferase involved in cell wall biosynthesis